MEVLVRDLMKLLSFDAIYVQFSICLMEAYMNGCDGALLRGHTAMKIHAVHENMRYEWK